jgi:hypothetical protein
MTVNEALKSLSELETVLRAYTHALGVLNYDGETAAPRNSAPARGETMAFLSGIIHQRVTAGETGELIDTLLANRESLSPADRRRAELLKKDRDELTLIPADEYMAYQQLLAENTPKVLSKLEMRDTTIAAYKEGMNLVVSHPDGTGYAGAWRNLPELVCAKTSTAEQYWGASDNGAFVCFTPMDEPEIAIAVYIEKGGHGSTLASIARAILRDYYNVGTVSDVNTYENKLS